MAKAAATLQIKQNVMFAGANYTDEKERCFEIDRFYFPCFICFVFLHRLACQIMKRAVDGAKEFIKGHVPQNNL